MPGDEGSFECGGLLRWGFPFSLCFGRRTEAGVTVLDVAIDEMDCEEVEGEGEGVKRVIAGTRALPFPFGRVELRRGDRGVAVRVELLDSEEAESDGDGEPERDEDTEDGMIVDEGIGEGGRCDAIAS